MSHEGTTDVKRAMRHAFIQEYELFRMRKGEIVSYVHKRFTHGKSFNWSRQGL